LRGFHGLQSPDPCRSRSVLTQSSAKTRRRKTTSPRKARKTQKWRRSRVGLFLPRGLRIQRFNSDLVLTADDSDGREYGDRRSHSPVRRAHPFGRLRMTLSGSRMGQGPERSRGAHARGHPIMLAHRPPTRLRSRPLQSACRGSESR
jgi:hypothetical protein